MALKIPLLVYILFLSAFVARNLRSLEAVSSVGHIDNYSRPHRDIIMEIMFPAFHVYGPIPFATRFRTCRQERIRTLLSSWPVSWLITTQLTALKPCRPWGRCELQTTHELAEQSLTSYSTLGFTFLRLFWGRLLKIESRELTLPLGNTEEFGMSSQKRYEITTLAALHRLTVW
jgi:hypothetical protein